MVLMIVLIPTFNEEECIRAVLDELVPICEPVGHRILIMDDGSTDATVSFVEAHPAFGNTIQLLACPHGGKDLVLWAGIEAADEEWLGMMDADGQYDPTDLIQLLKQARSQNADAAWGFRQRRDDSAWRLLISRGGKAAKKSLLGSTAVRDTGCGIWVARRPLLLPAIQASPQPAGQVHCHLPDLMVQQGGTVVECPITHRSRHAGQAKFGFLNRLGPGLRSLLQARRAKQTLRK
jgi:Glycosyl transferase family 2